MISLYQMETNTRFSFKYLFVRKQLISDVLDFIVQNGSSIDPPRIRHGLSDYRLMSLTIRIWSSYPCGQKFLKHTTTIGFDPKRRIQRALTLSPPGADWWGHILQPHKITKWIWQCWMSSGYWNMTTRQRQSIPLSWTVDKIRTPVLQILGHVNDLST